MICKIDLSPLMQRILDKGITFIISPSGIDKNYRLYFAKYTDKNRSVSMNYDEQLGVIYHCADENHAYVKFDNINDVIIFVTEELKILEGVQ